MSKKLILAAIATVFAFGTMQAPAFAKGGKHHHSVFNANGGNGGSGNKGNNSGNGGAGGTIKNAGKAKVKILVPGILILFAGLLILFGPFVVKFLNEDVDLGLGF